LEHRRLVGETGTSRLADEWDLVGRPLSEVRFERLTHSRRRRDEFLTGTDCPPTDLVVVVTECTTQPTEEYTAILL